MKKVLFVDFFPWNEEKEAKEAKILWTFKASLHYSNLFQFGKNKVITNCEGGKGVQV